MGPELMHRLIAVGGAAAMLGLSIALSRHRDKIPWRTVAWGVGAQWLFGLLLLKLPQGRLVLRKVAAGVQVVLDQAFEGSAFVFGELGRPGSGSSGLGTIFAFQVLPTIIFVASLFAILYHLGVMQWIVGALARVMVSTMKTSGAESLAVAASVFMGQTEAPLTIRPYLDRLTQSELFAVMVAGMASVSGAILGAYVLIGKIPMDYLLTAVMMSAPASLAFAKVVLPETEQPETAGAADVELPRVTTNVIDAAARGASDGLSLALNVGAMLIAFIALVALVNAIIGFIPVAGQPLSLERLLGWAFSPFAFAMGVPWSEAADVGSILGTRLVVNELVAFGDMAQMGALSERSRSIATVAICGFANLTSIGIQIGGLGALAPERKSDIARWGVLALAVATLANFSSACVTGALL